MKVHDIIHDESGSGCSAGVVGIALALAGADVTLTDLPHVTALTRENVAANCQSVLLRAQVLASVNHRNTY